MKPLAVKIMSKLKKKSKLVPLTKAGGASQTGVKSMSGHGGKSTEHRTATIDGMQDK